jgi:hypothetical protein
VDFKKQNPDRVTLLVGNHEMHYYDYHYACGRFDHEYFDAYHAVLTGEETAGLFQICRQIGRYLFIHAGLTKGWYDAHFDEMSKLGSTLEEQVNKLFVTHIGTFFEASMYRGGFHDAGSPLWADVSEFSEEPKHVDDNIIQIIGHTQLKGEEPMIIDNIRLLDNRQLYLLKNDEIVKYAPR